MREMAITHFRTIHISLVAPPGADRRRGWAPRFAGMAHMVDSDAETVLHADHESEEAEAAAFEAIHAVRFSPASPPTF